MIEEFRQTLESLEWKEKHRVLSKEVQKVQHLEFLDKLHQERLFKQEVYVLEKLIENEERKSERQKEMEFKH